MGKRSRNSSSAAEVIMHPRSRKAKKVISAHFRKEKVATKKAIHAHKKLLMVERCRYFKRFLEHNDRVPLSRPKLKQLAKKGIESFGSNYMFRELNKGDFVVPDLCSDEGIRKLLNWNETIESLGGLIVTTV
ncbi:hypothetical protein ACOME3_007023 [Neoechinorhynchus agilis]